MSTSNQGASTWENISIGEDNEFDYMDIDKDDDVDMSILDDDNSSSIEVGSFTTESTINNDDDEILPFSWDKLAFQNAQKSLDDNEINDEINWKDISAEERTETESIITMLTEDEANYQIENISSQLTSCVILDLIDGKIQCCSKLSSNQRPLAQLIGTWEIDGKIFINTKAENKLYSLGVCGNHFNFDQNTLHETSIKQKRSVENSWIYHRRCLFCNKYKYFFSRGSNCIQHSVSVIGRNVQAPCIGLKTCSVFNTQSTIIDRTNNEYRSRYICSQCFNSQGGHIFERQGSGKKTFSCEEKHENDTTNALELLGKWILNVAASKENDKKKLLLSQLSSVLLILNNNHSTHLQSVQSDLPPSLLLIKVALQLGKVNINKIMDNSHNFTLESSKTFGESLGIMTWKSRNEICEKRKELEKPDSLKHYQQNFPPFLANFFNGFIITLEKKKHEIVNKKRKQRNIEEKSFDIINAEKNQHFLFQ